MAEQSEQLEAGSQGEGHSQAGAPVPFCADEYNSYQLLSLIHAGTTGDVFKVNRVGLTGKTFALKVFKAELLEDKAAADRFDRQSNAIAALTHENLAAVYEHGKTAKGTGFIVTDFVDGTSLEKLVQTEGCLNDSRVLDISLQLCSLLDYLEQKGIAARGLDLADVLVTRNDEGAEVIKVVDLGIAKIFDATAGDAGPASDASLTMETLTKSFCHPDVRMLGSMMFKLLTGKSFSECSKPNQILIADQPARATRIVLEKDNTILKRDLRLVSAGALQMPAATQYQTIHDLQKALEKVSSGEALIPVAASSFGGSHKRILAGAVGLIIVGLLVSIPLLTPHSAGGALKTTVAAPVAETTNYKGSQQIKDKYGRVLYACDAPDQSACVSEALRAGINLAGAQISNVHLSGIKVEKISLANAHFTNCALFAMTLTNVNLDASQFSDCKLTRIKFNNDTLKESHFKNCQLNSTTFNDSQLRGARFEDCETGATVRKGKLSGVTFKSSTMNDVHLIGGNWSNSKLLSPMQNAEVTFNLSNSIIACNSLGHANFTGATIASSKIISPDAKSLTFKSLRDTTIEQKLPDEDKSVLKN